jgi:hypothetical protein
VIAVAVAAVGFILTLSFGFADHAPAPHGVRLAVAAPAGVARELTTGLAQAAPGGFTVVAAPSAAAVTGSVRSLDVVPLPAGDRAGLSAFVFELGLLLPSVIGSVLALDTIYGALTGASAALIGVGFFGSLTFVAFVTACQAVTGLPGTGLAALGWVDLLHLAERRRTPERRAEIYATSGTAHLRQRHARQRAAVLRTGPENDSAAASGRPGSASLGTPGR